MKLIVRISALTVVLAAAAAASFSSSTAHVMASSQAVSAKLPVPACGPGVPGCPTQPSTNR